MKKLITDLFTLSTPEGEALRLRRIVPDSGNTLYEVTILCKQGIPQGSLELDIGQMEKVLDELEGAWV